MNNNTSSVVAHLCPPLWPYTLQCYGNGYCVDAHCVCMNGFTSGIDSYISPADCFVSRITIQIVAAVSLLFVGLALLRMSMILFYWIYHCLKSGIWNQLPSRLVVCIGYAIYIYMSFINNHDNSKTYCTLV